MKGELGFLSSAWRGFSLPVFYEVVQLIQRIPVLPLFVPQETVNMFLTRSTVATWAIFVGLLVQLAAAMKVCTYCETIPADCYGPGKDCPALNYTYQLAVSSEPTVARKVCVI